MAKTAVVTGASGGIGRAIVEGLLAAGYRVGAVYHENADALNVFAGREIVPLAADLSQMGAAQTLAIQIEAQLGAVDVLVSSAGIARQGLFQTMPRKEVTRLYRVNLESVVELTRALVPSMIKRHSGAIVCVGSIWGEIGGACEVDYSATKGGIIAFVRALAKELGPSGIRVNAVSPGVIMTEMTRPLGEETLCDLADGCALGRIGTPQEVAAAVCFLASEKASYITGIDLPVNGGWI